MNDDNGTSSIAMFVLQIRKAMAEEKISVTLPQNWVIPVLCAIESAQKEIAQLSEARRVVPELTEGDLDREWATYTTDRFDDDQPDQSREYLFRHAYRKGWLDKSIPATRVLKDGEVGVDPREWNAMQVVFSCAEHLLSWYEPMNASIISNEKRHELHVAVEELRNLRTVRAAQVRTAQAKGAEG